jgi:predicted aldo/keto reductase-like oxidoreductase
MKYRRFGSLNWDVSALGFGAMRLPTVGTDRTIDEAEAVRMIRYAIDNGVNYLDTGYRYGEGKSEIIVGKALKDGYREKIRLATKMPIREVASTQDLNRIFDDQLAKLQTDHIDFYLFHGLRKESWLKAKELNAIDWAEKKIEEGRIGHLGFSFHDTFEVLKEVLDSYKGWAFFQMQYNYVDTESSSRTPGVKGLKYAAEKGLGVVVMEPVQGGNLAVKPPKEVETLLRNSKIDRSPVDLALQWVWNQPEVSLALSGMSSMDQIVENIESADRSGPGVLHQDELESISDIRDAILSHGFIGCTGCRYCQPCPQGVTIPEILAFYNEYYKNQDDSLKQQEIRKQYEEIVNSGTGADKCIRCGQCEDACPQNLPIRSLLSRAKMSLTQT